MCITSNSNTVFPCKICNTNIKDTDSAAQCDSFQFWIYMKCNNLNHIDYKYLQGSSVLGSASLVVMEFFRLEY